MQKITFHSFTMGDVEDPELYAAEPLYKFMQTEQGQWIKANCPDPQYIVRPDDHRWGHRIIVYGQLEDRLATEYLLRWGK
jgi:hypothetical protein